MFEKWIGSGSFFLHTAVNSETVKNGLRNEM